MKRILLAYDGSDVDNRALDTAAELAKAFGATVSVVSVIELMPARAGGPMPWDVERHSADLDAAVAKLTDGTRRVANGDFDVRIQVRSSDELGELAVAFNAMTQGLRERADMQNDLQIGRQIQAGFLPAAIPQPPGWEIAARFQPAREVAGDSHLDR